MPQGLHAQAMIAAAVGCLPAPDQRSAWPAQPDSLPVKAAVLAAFAGGTTFDSADFGGLILRPGIRRRFGRCGAAIDFWSGHSR